MRSVEGDEDETVGSSASPTSAKPAWMLTLRDQASGWLSLLPEVCRAIVNRLEATDWIEIGQSCLGDFTSCPLLRPRDLCRCQAACPDQARPARCCQGMRWRCQADQRIARPIVGPQSRYISRLPPLLHRADCTDIKASYPRTGKSSKCLLAHQLKTLSAVCRLDSRSWTRLQVLVMSIVSGWAGSSSPRHMSRRLAKLWRMRRGGLSSSSSCTSKWRTPLAKVSALMVSPVLLIRSVTQS